MAGAGLTHSQVAAKLIVEGCLANIAGNVQGKMPMTPVVLSELERADIGLKQGGNTLFYEVLPTGVFFDMDGPVATVWFMEADADRGLPALENAMKQAFPRTKQLSDAPNPKDPKARVRSYEVDFGNSRLARVDVDYPERGAPARRFVARIVAQARRR